MIIVGQAAIARADGAGVATLAAKLAQSVGALSDTWNGYNILHTAASRVGGLDIGFVPAKGGLSASEMLKAARRGKLDVLFLLGADECDLSGLEKSFVVYIGSHGDRGAHAADVILPAAAYTEKSGTWVNTEGRPQMSQRAVFPPGDAREDWTILRALSAHLGMTLPYDTLDELRADLYAAHPHLAALGERPVEAAGALDGIAKGRTSLGKKPFRSLLKDFYLTNPIARASAVMGQMSALKAGASEKATGTDG
jgi:NADH-quinone oxidoreductase subunit G